MLVRRRRAALSCLAVVAFVVGCSSDVAPAWVSNAFPKGDTLVPTGDTALGGFTCGCAPGYEYVDSDCQDVDECALESDDCADDAECTDSDGGYLCACKVGFAGDGKTCEACQDGYVGDGLACTDVDECFADPPACLGTSVCENLPGAFVCACEVGFDYVGGDWADFLVECALDRDRRFCR